MCHLASPPQTDGSPSHYLEKMKKKPCFTVLDFYLFFGSSHS
jgi:hypothetical protein